MKTYCLTLDLKTDPILIEEYKQYHKQENIWPAVVENIKDVGILSEEIYLIGNRLFMILQTTDDFSFQAKIAADHANPDMQKWADVEISGAQAEKANSRMKVHL